ncbi:bifunctional adenosylcobinamide kinase/adenosylcobinamide-phosphate guanylyltransferase [Collinsella sp. An2]|uniref:bifunctional adenosylcobinamide kinase/adenosylcobinamide-phosphate guanylyltransferase n=1 Tax=Collinsella sp. An2 TaxID=1965585 RepID=UPI000B371F14|nr:bifunctional adenosylcobinamide kinase/adenosylcobinamide-phosphate guanylyltransferase [Collinsella sp. An2]OUP09139.1 hypothetical protein B5F33_05220 [Collinsella sp. An2]
MQALVIGGAASGKSAFAEELCTARGGTVLYVATMEAAGTEAARRIARHRELRRGKGFRLLECSRDLARAVVPSTDVVLVEDVGNLLANELWSPDSAGVACGGTLAEDRVVEAVLDGIDVVAAAAQDCVVVTNSIASDGVSYAPETVSYQRAIARVNARLARRADAVVEVVVGLPVWMRGNEEMWRERGR